MRISISLAGVSGVGIHARLLDTAALWKKDGGKT